MFELTAEEADSVRCQFGTLQTGLHFRYSPYAFTEQGVAMLSSVLQSPRAVLVNIAVMRAFVRLRETLSLHKELAHKLAELERRIESHDASPYPFRSDPATDDSADAAPEETDRIPCPRKACGVPGARKARTSMTPEQRQEVLADN